MTVKLLASCLSISLSAFLNQLFLTKRAKYSTDKVAKNARTNTWLYLSDCDVPFAPTAEFSQFIAEHPEERTGSIEPIDFFCLAYGIKPEDAPL